MLSGVHFYHATIKRVVSVFGTIFNNIIIGRYDGSRMSNTMRVPISYGPRQKFIVRMNQDLGEQRVAIKLPRMSFEITSIDYDTSTKLNKLNKTVTPSTNKSTRTTMFQSVPYTLGMQLNIMARNQEDALQVLEQILPTFSPEYTVTIKDIEGPDSKTDVPIVLNGVSFTDEYEGVFTGRRTLIYTLDFTIRVRFAPDTSTATIIRRISTDIGDFTISSIDTATPLSQVGAHMGSDVNSPSDSPIKTFVSLVNPNDTHIVNLINESLVVSGIVNQNTINSFSISSGDSPDYDRVEDSPSNLVFNELGGTSSASGIGASFNVTVDSSSPNATGQLTSITLASSGSGYQNGELITIKGTSIGEDSPSDSPYRNLVLEVSSSLDTPSVISDSPIGTIQTFNVISGNSPEADRFESYSPTITRLSRVASGGTGEGARFDVELNRQTGAVNQVTIVNTGQNYSLNDLLTISATSLGEDSPAGDSPSDSPNLNLILKVDSLSGVEYNGRYIRSGSSNDRPKYILDSPNSPHGTPVEIIWGGTRWDIQESNSPFRQIAFNDLPNELYRTMIPKGSSWQSLLGNDVVTVSSIDNSPFLATEEVVGNISLNAGTVISSNGEDLTITNLEGGYVDGEILVGQKSNIARTVFNTVDSTGKIIL